MKNQKIVTTLSIFLLAIIVYLSIMYFIRLYNSKNLNYGQNQDLGIIPNRTKKREVKCLKFEAGSCVSKEWKPLKFFEKGEKEFLISGIWEI